MWAPDCSSALDVCDRRLLACRPSICPSDHVFLRNIAPFRPFRRGDGISSTVKSLMQLAGLVAPVKGCTSCDPRQPRRFCARRVRSWSSAQDRCDRARLRSPWRLPVRPPETGSAATPARDRGPWPGPAWPARHAPPQRATTAAPCRTHRVQLFAAPAARKCPSRRRVSDATGGHGAETADNLALKSARSSKSSVRHPGHGAGY